MKKLLVAIVVTLIGFTANAGIHVEPYLGYRIGSGDYGSADLSYSGVNMGGRLGYSFMMVTAGLDYNMGSTGVEFKTTSGSTDVDFKTTQMGAFVMASIPMIRGWATYYFDSSFEQDEGSNAGKEFTGSGMGLGVGFTGLPFISLNFEYKSLEHDEFDGNALTDDFKVTEYLFSVSAPFDF
jgi:hypothetical protein